MQTPSQPHRATVTARLQFVIEDVGALRRAAVEELNQLRGMPRDERHREIRAIEADVTGAAAVARLIDLGCGADRLPGTRLGEVIVGPGTEPQAERSAPTVWVGADSAALHPDHLRPEPLRPDHLDSSLDAPADPARVTARTAEILWRVLRNGADLVYDDIEALGDDTVAADSSGLAVLADLPPLTFTADAIWRRQMARAFDDLADDIAAGRPPYPRCTGEAVALWLTLDWAPAYVADHVTGHLAANRATPDDDNWEDLRGALFRDTDFLELFNPAMDGFEHTEEATYLGVENMNPRDWFKTLSFAAPRDPRRPFRR